MYSFGSQPFFLRVSPLLLWLMPVASFVLRGSGFWSSEGHQLAAAWCQAFRSTDWSSAQEVTFYHYLSAQGVPETKKKFWKQWMERLVILFLFQKTKLAAFRWIIPAIETKKKSIFNKDYIRIFFLHHTLHLVSAICCLYVLILLPNISVCPLLTQ